MRIFTFCRYFIFPVSFRNFIKRFSALKFPLTATEFIINNRVPKVESTKLKRLSEQNGTKRQKVKIRNFFIRLYMCLRYRGLNQIMIYTDCNRIRVCWAFNVHHSSTSRIKLNWSSFSSNFIKLDQAYAISCLKLH